MKKIFYLIVVSSLHFFSTTFIHANPLIIPEHCKASVENIQASAIVAKNEIITSKTNLLIRKLLKVLEVGHFAKSPIGPLSKEESDSYETFKKSGMNIPSLIKDEQDKEKLGIFLTALKALSSKINETFEHSNALLSETQSLVKSHIQCLLDVPENPWGDFFILNSDKNAFSVRNSLDKMTSESKAISITEITMLVAYNTARLEELQLTFVSATTPLLLKFFENELHDKETP